MLLRLEDAGDRLDYYPAAQRLHHAERSGLLHHTSTMLKGPRRYASCIRLDGDLLAAGSHPPRSVQDHGDERQ